MIAAQVLSIVAFLISWIWWVTFIIAIVALVLLQIVWCCRQSKNGLFVSVGIAAVTGCTCVAAGIIMLVTWKNRSWCTAFVQLDDDDDIYASQYDDCREEVWATVAFITAALWFSAAGLVFYFVKSGQHAKWEERIQRSIGDSDGDGDAATTTIEMGAVQPETTTGTNGTTETSTNQGTPAVETAVAMPVAVDSYVPPQTPEKVDDAV